MTRPRDILIVGADSELRGMLVEALDGDDEFRVAHVAGVAEAIARMELHQTRVEAIIVQLAPIDSDGSEPCARLRRHGLCVPIIVLSEEATEEAVVQALEAGANDYMVKPIRLAELKARLRAHIREHDTSEDAVLTVGPYQFRPGARSLHHQMRKQTISLTAKEASILKCLLRATGGPVSRQALLRDVWGYSARSHTHTVETHIYRLRRKIEHDPSRPTIIVNDGEGYLLGHGGNGKPVRHRVRDGRSASDYRVVETTDD